MGAVASQITSLTIIYSTVYSDADQRKLQSSASLAFVRGIHRTPENVSMWWRHHVDQLRSTCICFSLTISKGILQDRVTHICVSKLNIIGSDNGLSPGRCHAIIRTNAGILLIETLGINCSEILIEIHIFLFKKMRLKISSGKRR